MSNEVMISQISEMEIMEAAKIVRAFGETDSWLFGFMQDFRECQKKEEEPSVAEFMACLTQSLYTGLSISPVLEEAYLKRSRGNLLVCPTVKGLEKLAISSGAMTWCDVLTIYENDTLSYDEMTHTATLTRGLGGSSSAVGYLGNIELHGGQIKSVYWPRIAVEMHAATYSKSYQGKNSPWKTNFDDMAKKTVKKDMIKTFCPGFERRTKK